MEKVFSATNSTNATLVTVKYFLSIAIVIPEFANRAKIFGELGATFTALIGYALPCRAESAYDFLNLKPVYFTERVKNSTNSLQLDSHSNRI